MEKLKFIKPTKEYEQQAYDYIQEFKDYNSDIFGTGGLHKYIGQYDEWLERLEQDRVLVPTEEKVPQETFFLIRESDNKLLGISNIRLALNDALLQRSGHIGYAIRPTERRKGYNNYQLYCDLKFCKEKGIEKVLLACYKDNVGSAKTILNNGGVLENEIIDPENGKPFQRFWIDVDQALEIGKEKYEEKSTA